MAKRIEFAPASSMQPLLATGVAGIRVVAEKPGPVNWLDKLRAYYKFAIALVGVLVTVLNESTPLLDFLAADKNIVTTVISVLTAVGVFLTNNQTWVDNL